MTTRHLLAELHAAPGLDWMVRCDCGWQVFYFREPITAARAFFLHAFQNADDRYTWSEMEDEWHAGHAQGYDQGFEEGLAEGETLGRQKLLSELIKAREIGDADAASAE